MADAAEQSLYAGDASYVDEQYDEALAQYSAAIVNATDPMTKFRLHSHRAATFLQLSRPQEALDDAVEGCGLVNANTLSGLRPGETELCWRRQGIAALHLGKKKEATAALTKASQLAMLNHRDVQFDYDAQLRLCVDSTSPSSEPSDQTKPVGNVESSARSTSKNTVVPPKYQYYQSDKVMTIAILEPNVRQSDLVVNFASDTIVVKLTKAGQDFTVVSGSLSETVDVDQCKIAIKDEKVLIKLRKVEAGEWSELLSLKKKVAAPPAVSSATTNETQPESSSASKTRPYASHKDWNNIEKELVAEEEKEKPQGDEAMNSLFQQIYANADPDTRRAMVKSYQTSGGTVLSTNWGEVKQKDYEEERTAPKGMEWKTWEGKKLPQEDD